MKKLKDLRMRDYLMIGAALVLVMGFGWYTDREAAVDAPAQAAPAAPPAAQAAWPGAAPGAPVAMVPPAAAGQAVEAGWQQLAIVDAQGFEQPMAAYTIQVPANWRGSGEVRWRAGGCATPARSVSFAAATPDGTQGVEILPGWYSRAVQPGALLTAPAAGCATMPFAGLRDYLAYLAQQRHPGGQLLDYAERPELVAQMLAKYPLAQLPATELQRSSARYEAGQALVGWTDNGRAMREMIVSIAVVTDIDRAMDMSMMAGGERRSEHARDLLVASTLVLRAPDGKLDFALAEHVRASLQANAAWNARVQQADAGTAQASMQTLTAGHEARMAAIHAAGAASTQAYNDRMAAMDVSQAAFMRSMTTPDATQRRTLEGIGEYNTWRGVDGNPVQYSIHGGERVFQSTTDSSRVYSTNDPYARPADGFQELQREQ